VRLGLLLQHLPQALARPAPLLLPSAHGRPEEGGGGPAAAAGQPLQGLAEGEDQLEVVDHQLAHGLGQVVVDNLSSITNRIALVVRGDRANQPVLDKDVLVAALQGVTVAQPQQLGGPRGLAAGDVDKQEQPLQELVHLL
jgi:hypothetical protein